MTDHPSTARFYILIFLALILAACRSHPQVAPSSTGAPTISVSMAMPTETSTPTPLVLENGWYLYQDPESEFSFSYPPTSTISAGQNPVDFSKNILIQFFLPEKTYQGMSIRLELNPKRLGGADIAKQLFERSAQKPAAAEFTNSIQQVRVGGTSAVQVSIPSTNTEVTVIIPYNDKVFIISPVHDASTTKVEKATLELFYQILNTLKFGSSK
jgi:hypothetical protein